MLLAQGLPRTLGKKCLHGFGGQRIARQLRCFHRAVDRNDQPNNDNFQEVAIVSRGRLNAIARATKNTIRDVIVPKSIHKIFVGGERLDQRLVLHDGVPDFYFLVDVHQNTLTKKRTQKSAPDCIFRFRAASCLVSVQSFPDQRNHRGDNQQRRHRDNRSACNSVHGALA